MRFSTVLGLLTGLVLGATLAVMFTPGTSPLEARSGPPVSPPLCSRSGWVLVFPYNRPERCESRLPHGLWCKDLKGDGVMLMARYEGTVSIARHESIRCMDLLE